MLLLLYILCFSQTLGVSLTAKSRLTMSALDCRVPRQVRNGLFASICKQEQPKVVPEEDVLLLQYSTKRVISGYRCEKRETRIREICGFSSHTKLFEPPDILMSVPMTPEQCKQTVDRWTFIKEDGNSIIISPNRVYYYKYLAHGTLRTSEDNVGCSGAKVTINGEIHDSLVEMISAEILIKEISLEIDFQKAIDLDNHTPLPAVCSREVSCQAGSVAYVLKHPENSCPLYTIRSLKMQRIEVEISTGPAPALLSREHKLLLPLGQQEVAHSECHPVFGIQATTYADLKVVTSEHAVASVANLAQHLPPSVVDLDLELRTSEEFLAFLFEESMKNNLKQVSSSICKMGKHGLGISELSPFHPNSLLRLRGDIIQELTCIPVIVDIRIGEKRSDLCTMDALPAWLHNQPIYVQSDSHLIVEEADISAISCDSTYQPIFMAADEKTLVSASPDVKVVELTLSHLDEDYLHLVNQKELVHTSFNKDLLYTHEEMSKFNDMLHFQRTRKRVVNAMVAQYCAGNPSCGSYQPGGAASTFSLDSLKDKVYGPFSFLSEWEGTLEKYGAYCSLLILLIAVLSTIYKVTHVIWLTFRRKLGFKQALKLGLFVNHTMIDALLEQPIGISTPAPSRRPPIPTPIVEETIPLQRREEHSRESIRSSHALVPYNRHEYSWSN